MHIGKSFIHPFSAFSRMLPPGQKIFFFPFPPPNRAIFISKQKFISGCSQTFLSIFVIIGICDSSLLNF